MSTKTFDVPALFGDHHVVELRRLLFELPGVKDVYASSAFQAVEVSFDPEKVSEQNIQKILDESGYVEALEMPVEAGVAMYPQEDRSQAFFRHTEAFETTKEVVSFTQQVNYTGRPLWNCPGMGVIKHEMED